MKCRICKKEACVALRSHNTAFCATCFIDFFERQVERGIEQEGLLKKEDKILVALSGGKDSLSAMLSLSKLGYDVTGLFVDLVIPGSSEVARSSVERFCQKHNIPLLVKDMANEGLELPLVKSVVRRPICSVCGMIKRYFFNVSAKVGGFSVLATGHNLDDEVARLFSNTLRWDKRFLSTQQPGLPEEHGFVRKIKPLWRVTEFETANYAFLCGIETHYAPCPYSQGASFSVLKTLMHRLERLMPGKKLDFYQSFLKHGRPTFAQQSVGKEMITPCVCCGYPTSADGLCGVCRLRDRMQKRERN
ncbi:MAG: adenine nucleotide alpha hydrolase family protein [Desulfovibrio sp.]|nr:adenine nucleotide alpha hydrolase family protein [Desulfovibrio sp.]